MKKISLLLGLLIAGFASQAQTAQVQMMHNSPDAAASQVDVWVDNTPAVPGFEFRTATPFLDVPAGVDVEIRIQPAGAPDTTNPLYFETVNLTAGENYIAVANGIVSASGYSNAPPLNIDVFPLARTQSVGAGETDVLVYHGSPDAPPVNVEEVGAGAGTVISNIAYSEFEFDYLELPNADYLLQVQDTTGAVTVREYAAPLQTLGLADSALTVVASGFLNPRENSMGASFGLFAVLPSGGDFIELPASTAAVQIAHNSPDEAAESVDIWITGSAGEVLAKLDEVQFRTGTPVAAFPAASDASIDIEVHIAPDTSTTVNSAIYSQVLNPTKDSSYLAVASGEVAGLPSLNIDLYQGLLTEARTPGTVDVLAYHGAPDAPTVDVFEEGLSATLFDDLAYGEFQGYLEAPVSDLSLVVQDETGSVNVRKYDVPLDQSGLSDSALVVLASGYLNPVQHNDDPGFGLFALLPSGGQFLELPLQTGDIQVIHNSADAAAETVELFVEGPVGEQIAHVPGFSFRTATPFVDLPSGIDLKFHVAPEGSDSISQSIFDAEASLTKDESYVAVANGIISQSGYDPGAGTDAAFDIFINTARKSAVNTGETDVLIFHGATDAPEVNVVESGLGAGIISSNLQYGNFDGYVELATNDYELEIQTIDGNPVAGFDAPLSMLGLQDEAITVLASGFLNPDENSDGAEFGLWAAVSAGGPLIELDRLTTSVEELSKENSTVSVYPNPAVEEIHFEISGADNALLEIFNLSGSLISTVNLNNKVKRVNLADYSSGTYIYRIKNIGKVETGKFNVTK